MTKWVTENAVELLGVAAAVLATVVGILTAEGGRRRRQLRTVREQVELLHLLRSGDVPKRLEGQLRKDARRSMERYLEPRTLADTVRAYGPIVAIAIGWVVFFAYEVLLADEQATGLSPRGSTGDLIVLAPFLVGFTTAVALFFISFVVLVAFSRRTSTRADNMDTSTGPPTVEMPQRTDGTNRP